MTRTSLFFAGVFDYSPILLVALAVAGFARTVGSGAIITGVCFVGLAGVVLILGGTVYVVRPTKHPRMTFWVMWLFAVV